MNHSTSRLLAIKDYLKRIKLPHFDKSVSYTLSRLKVLGIGLLLCKFCTVLQNNNYMLKSFSVTPALERSGYNGKMLTEQVIDYMEDIINYKDPSTSRGNAYRQLGKAFSESVVLTVEESTESNPYDPDIWFKAGKKILGQFMNKEKYISGSIVNDIRDSSQMIVTIQITGRPLKKIPIIKIKDETILFKTAACAILEETNPIALFDYYIKIDNLDKAESILKSLRRDKAYNIERTKKFRIDVSAITLLLAQAHELENNVNDIAKRNEAYDKRISAIYQSDALIKNYSDDVSAYVQKLNSLTFFYNWFDYLDSTNLKDKVYLESGKAFIEKNIGQFENPFAAYKKEIEGKKMKSDFYNIEQAYGFIFSTIGYLSYSFKKAKQEDVIKYYADALKYSPDDVFVLNSVAYFYAYKRDTFHAYHYIGKALENNEGDGNLMDSYAEIAWSFKDKLTFYRYFEQALKHPKPIDGITREQYEEDGRWYDLWQESHFQKLMEQNGSTTFVDSIRKLFRPKEANLKLTTLEKKTSNSKTANYQTPQYKEALGQVSSQSH